jgi:hypothetical protein
MNPRLGLNHENMGECPHLFGVRGVRRFWNYLKH